MHAFRIAYDGRPYHGFQRQPDVPTVEGAILDALRGLDVLAEDADVPPGYAAAGRTDAGVSALAQTIAFEAPPWLTPAALNSRLPAAVRAWARSDVPAGFHATHDAERRTYAYYLHAPEADCDLARTAVDALSGRHDVHNLTTDDENTVRELTAAVTVDGPFLVFRLSAGGFNRQLVRRAVSLVREIATGTAPPSKVDRVLDAAPLDGPEGVPPAPACPLVLEDVTYSDVAFEADPDAVASARALFEERRVERSTAARVAEHVRDGLPFAPGDEASDGE